MRKRVIGMILTLSMIATLTACGGAVSTTSEAPVNTDTTAEATEEKTESVAEDPCKDGHTWVDATCTEPKTCSVCGTTEGEALGHEWEENTPNYQQAKTCTRCGETDGEPLEAEFEKKGIYVVTEWDKPYSFTTNENTIKGTHEFANLKKVDSDDELGLETVEGYEWLIFDYITRFDDDNALKIKELNVEDWGGATAMDYYDTYNVGNANLDTVDSFTVNYNGVDYTDCRYKWGEPTYEYNKSNDYNGDIVPVYIRIPVGYDGIVITTFGNSVLEKLMSDENAKVIDLMDESCTSFRVTAK